MSCGSYQNMWWETYTYFQKFFSEVRDLSLTTRKVKANRWHLVVCRKVVVLSAYDENYRIKMGSCMQTLNPKPSARLSSCASREEEERVCAFFCIFSFCPWRVGSRWKWDRDVGVELYQTLWWISDPRWSRFTVDLDESHIQIYFLQWWSSTPKDSLVSISRITCDR